MTKKQLRRAGAVDRIPKPWDRGDWLCVGVIVVSLLLMGSAVYWGFVMPQDSKGHALHTVKVTVSGDTTIVTIEDGTEFKVIPSIAKLLEPDSCYRMIFIYRDEWIKKIVSCQKIGGVMP